MLLNSAHKNKLNKQAKIEMYQFIAREKDNYLFTSVENPELTVAVSENLFQVKRESFNRKSSIGSLLNLSQTSHC